MPTRSPSPEMLQQRIRLIEAPTWSLVAVLLGAVIAALVWGVFGTVLVQVSGRGLLVHTDNQQIPVFSLEQARLMKTRFSIGDSVTAGQVLFDLNSPAIDIELDIANQRLTELGNLQKVVAANAAEAIGKQEHVARDQLASLEKQYLQLKERADFYLSQLGNQEALLKKGFTTFANVEAMRERRDDAALQLIQSEAKRAQVENELLLNKVTWQRQQMDAQLAVDQQRTRMSEIDERRKRASQILAHRDGIISEILVNDGQLVAAGSKVAIVSTRQAGYEVLAFFKPPDGKRLVVGMEADVIPSTVKREEYGTMKGVVGSASIRPMSLAQTTELLGNETLARYLTSDDPPIMGRITVMTQPGEPERFAWRNGTGPPFSVTTGTVTDVSVTVQRQAPVALVLPYLKTLVGL
jgi:HlyD family secretion protein